MSLYRRKGIFRVDQFEGPEAINANDLPHPMLPEGAHWRAAYGNQEVLLPCLPVNGYPYQLKIGDYVIYEIMTDTCTACKREQFEAEYEALPEPAPTA